MPTPTLTLTPELLDLEAAGLFLVAEIEAYLASLSPAGPRVDVAALLAAAPVPVHGSVLQAWNAAHPLPVPTLLDRARGRRPRLDVTPSEYLDLMSRYLHQHGWVQGQLWDTDGRVCVLGALLRVYTAGYGTPDTVRRVRQRIGNALGRIGARMPVDTWNDLPTTTRTDVHHLLRDAAA
ncbi:DUF6197 family protein [Kitasatospora terrestris]|uniref:Uncharacterized protein n=1 Tax=Kitasatospora terrestris TaxID=258051 RepID=A0ABP9E276_9ACTN